MMYMRSFPLVKDQLIIQTMLRTLLTGFLIFVFSYTVTSAIKVNLFFRSSSLLSPIVSVLAMTKDGNVNTLQKNATLSFKIKVNAQFL